MVFRVFAAIIALTLGATWTLAQETEEREGGIIGTGIVGTITRLGSIHVNGQHIEIDDTLPVTDSVPPIAAGALQPGQTVAVIAQLDDGIWRAQHIRQILPLVGPVTAISEARITVLGTQVDLSALPPHVGVGDWVAISGLWQGHRVLASGVEVLPQPLRLARLSGTYLGPDQDGSDVIGGSSMTGIRTRHLQPGDLVRVAGRPTPDGIEATRLETRLFDEQVGIIQVEGYYSEPQPSGLYTVLGSGLVAYTDRPEMINIEDRITQCGEAGYLGKPALNPTDTEAVQKVLAKLDCGF